MSKKIRFGLLNFRAKFLRNLLVIISMAGFIAACVGKKSSDKDVKTQDSLDKIKSQETLDSISKAKDDSINKVREDSMRKSREDSIKKAKKPVAKPLPSDIKTKYGVPVKPEEEPIMMKYGVPANFDEPPVTKYGIPPTLENE